MGECKEELLDSSTDCCVAVEEIRAKKKKNKSCSIGKFKKMIRGVFKKRTDNELDRIYCVSVNVLIHGDCRIPLPFPLVYTKSKDRAKELMAEYQNHFFTDEKFSKLEQHTHNAQVLNMLLENDMAASFSCVYMYAIKLTE